MTSSDMPDTPAGRRAAQADGPRSARPKRRTFTGAYKLAMIEKYDAATERRLRREPAALHPPPQGTQDARHGLDQQAGH